MTCLYSPNRAILPALALLFVGYSCWCPPVSAQPASPQPSAQAAPEEPAASQPAPGLYLEGVTLAPFSRPRLGRALTILAVVRNSSATARRVIAVAKINSVPDFQGAAAVEVPPGQQRGVELRLRIPATLREKNLEYSVSLNDPENPNQVLLGGNNTPLVDQRRLSLNEDWLVTALAMHPPEPPLPDWYYPQSDLVMEYELVVAARADSSNSRRTLTIDHVNLPSQAADWQGIDEIVISNDRPFQDPAVVGAINRWVASGGRAWIMFDQVAPENVRQLLMDGMSCEMLDDIELNRFVVESTAFNKLNVADRTVEIEQPARLRRVVQSGGEVSLSIDGYPVAIWYRIGKGMVLLTTLEPEGWLQPRTSQRKEGEDFSTPFQLRAWATAMADRLHEINPTLSPIEFAEVQYPLQQIGNPVLDRRYVLVIVFGFCAVLGSVAGVCWLTNQMMRLAWLIPLISLAATAPLLISSTYQRRDIPDTTAHLQVIEVLPGSQTIQAMQWTATYLHETEGLKLLGDGDAMVSWPESSAQQDLRRWTWLDYGKWELSSSGWPNGLWQLQSRYALPKKNLDVIAQIDEQGLKFQLPEELEHTLHDAVVQYWPGDPVPCGVLKPRETIRVPELQLAQTDSWLTDSIVSDEQRRRDQVYRQARATSRDQGYPSYHSLMGWTDLWPGPITWNQERDQRGSALVALPIKLQPTPSGQRVHVPHTVIHIENANLSGSLSTAFSNSSGWWRGEATLPAEVSLRCSLPREVCPLQADQIACTFQMRAPQRKVKLYAVRPMGEKELIQELVSPTGVQTIRITDAGWLSEMRDGVIDFELNVGTELTLPESTFGDQQAIWQVDYFRLSVDGQVSER